jgi:DNA-binding response OmpR family regulator
MSVVTVVSLAPTTITYAGYVLATSRAMDRQVAVSWNGTPLQLDDTEFWILHELVLRQTDPVTTERLCAIAAIQTEATLKQHIASLRQKLHTQLELPDDFNPIVKGRGHDAWLLGVFIIHKLRSLA